MEIGDEGGDVEGWLWNVGSVFNGAEYLSK